MTKWYLPLVLMAFYFPGIFSGTADAAVPVSVHPVNLCVEYLRNPGGLDVVQPRLGWTLTATDRAAFGQRQTAYRLLVAASGSALDNGQGDVWDSGWVDSDQTQHILYAGSVLQSDRTYYWKVQVKDEKGVVSAWSETAHWSTGWLRPDEWRAKWIGSEEQYDRLGSDNNVQDPWFRKTFKLMKKPARATVFVASVGYHELYVNGERIGEEVLAPAATDHTKRARYIAYDIADKLRPGVNTIGLWLGTSWAIFPAYVLHADRPLTPVVSAQVTVYNHRFPQADEEPVYTAITDASWKTHPSPSRLLGKWDFRKMGGEIVDARRDIPEWNKPSYDDSGWKAATEYPVKLTLSAQAVEGNRLFDEIRPVAIEKRPDGSYRVDMGVNFAGWTEVRVKGRAGDTIRFQYSERADHDMSFNLHSAYVIGTSGTGTFKNRFNYSSGQWITIHGLKEAPGKEDIKGWMVRTDYRDATKFTCSDSLQNWIYDRVCWTFENLSLGGYIVDCPQRERMGYGGDAHATSETGMFNYQLGAFYTKWMEDWRDVQGTESMVGDMLDSSYARKATTSGRLLNNGVLPHTAPTYWGGGGPAWGGIVVTLPWLMYHHYGDKRVLEDNFSLMGGWLSFLESHREEELLRRFGGQWDFLGDWLWPNATAEGMNNDKEETLCLNNAYYVFNLRTAATVARIIGRTAEAGKWEQQAEATARAVQGRFFRQADYSYGDGSMANQAAALLAGIPPAAIREEVMHRLEKEILEIRNGHIHAGITGGALLFRLLRDEGRDDLIYSMLSKTTYPGWGFMKASGATTLWEAWEKDLEGHSVLHSSYLYPGAWYIDGAAGIRRDPQHPGFRRFIVRPPAPGATDLSWVSAAYDSPVGQIVVRWSREDGRLKLQVTVPPNSLALIQVHPTEELDVSGYPGMQRVVSGDGFVQYEAIPGTYQLTAVSGI